MYIGIDFTFVLIVSAADKLAISRQIALLFNNKLNNTNIIII